MTARSEYLEAKAAQGKGSKGNLFKREHGLQMPIGFGTPGGWVPIALDAQLGGGLARHWRHVLR
eukprot:4689684-Alexandrium_andersonii.AAC.1